MYNTFFKRFLDVAVALALLLLSSPIFLLIMLLNYFAFEGKPFFFQPRPGLDGKTFSIIKFKTMLDEAYDGQKDEERLTILGHWLRKSSLDELPQLFLVLSGRMSLIGPRPLLCEYLPLYSTNQARRHAVRPGITGWAQVKGRNHLDWPEKLDMDVWYVDNVGFFLDLKILWLTFWKVLYGTGVEGKGKVIVEKFTGQSENA